MSSRVLFRRARCAQEAQLSSALVQLTGADHQSLVAELRAVRVELDAQRRAARADSEAGAEAARARAAEAAQRELELRREGEFDFCVVPCF